ncbi:DUF6292 family protein [Streptomyces sp. NPDC098789]|uniref:DUF6292 family protein n=1 Tax=Streptomyces sp. NPDC098789 TaxID=3366098 RepID=UPI0038014090
MDYHDAHSPYLAAVVAALALAGITVSDWTAEPDDPRTGILALDPASTPVYPGDDVALVWDEARGWSLVWGPDGHTSGYDFSHALASNVLPSPAEITTAVREGLTAPLRGDVTFSGYYRDPNTDDDGFEDLLRAYTR